MDQALLEEKGHEDALRQFAAQCAVPHHVAVEAYRREKARLTASARIRRYVGVIAEKHAKEEVRRARRSGR